MLSSALRGTSRVTHLRRPLYKPQNIQRGFARPTPSSEFSKIDFNDPSSAFKNKTTGELVRAWVIFRLCAITPLVNHSESLLRLSSKILGKTLTNYLVRKTFFAHFCAGEDGSEIQPVLARLRSFGIGGILDYAAENDVTDESQWEASNIEDNEGYELREKDREGVMSAHVYSYVGEEDCERNARIFLQCIEAVAPNPQSFAAIKVTGKPSLLERVSTVLLAIRKLFSVFAEEGTITLKQFASKLRELGVKLTDGEIETLFYKFDTDKSGTIDYIEWTQTLTLQDLTTRALFTTERYDMDVLAKAGNLPLLNEEDTHLLDNMVNRLNRVAEEAAKAKVRLMIDAEHTYIQPAIDNFALELQRKYNQEFPAIFNTYQCYLMWSKQHMLHDLERAKREGWIFAGKLVRGAYMVLERKRAAEKNLPSPVLPTIEATHENYNSCVEIVLEDIHRANVMIASHNQDSVERVLEYMARHNVNKERVFFGQLLGMADHLSFTLGQHDYGVYKYVPYGPVEEVMPYLIRRAQENAAMMAGADHERSMLSTELLKRFGLRPKSPTPALSE